MGDLKALLEDNANDKGSEHRQSLSQRNEPCKQLENLTSEALLGRKSRK